jgi:aminopeptidase YwaD
MLSLKKIILFLVLFSMLLSGSVFAQKTILLKENIIWEIIAEASGVLQLNNIMRLGPYEMNRPESEYLNNYRETDFMLKILKQYGFSDVHVERFDAPPQWDAVMARLTVLGPRKEIIADLDRVAASLAIGSISGNVKTELVYIPKGIDKNSYKNLNVKKKIVISEGHISSIFNAAVNHNGAAGAVSYQGRYPLRYPDMLMWSTVIPDKKNPRGFGFQISYRRGKELIARLKKGEKVILQARVETKYYPHKHEVVTALIPGTDRASQELLIIAHLYEGIAKQGANDNYSGVACTLETGRVILKLIKEGVIKPPRRSIRFLWPPENVGSRAYIKKHPHEIKRAFAGINMDMVGQHMVMARSIFYLCRSSWAVPSFFNDVVQEFAELTRDMNNSDSAIDYRKMALQITSSAGSQLPFLMDIYGFDSGSDHVEFSNGNVKVPCVFFCCWPDDFYHSNMDTPDKSDPTRLKRIAFMTAASAITATGAKPEDAITFAALSAGKGRRRIAFIYENSIKRMHTAKATGLYTAYKRAAITIEQSYKHEIANLKSLRIIAEDEKNAILSIENQAANFNTEMNASLISLFEMYKLLCWQHDVKPVQLVLTQKEEEMSRLIPVKKARGMVAQMALKMSPGLPKSHAVYKYSHAAWELANHIDGKKNMLEIAHAVLAECGGPMPEKSAEFFYSLKKNGVIELKKK